MPPRPRSLAERFKEKVGTPTTDGCLPWIGGLNKAGYGRLGDQYDKRAGKTVLAHRVAYILRHGDIPDGLHVCHHCDHPWCVNVEHLFLGTNYDNILDSVRKGRKRGPHGAACAHAKLNEDEVRQIRLLFSQGKHRVDIAHQFNITTRTVNGIASRETWTSIT